MDISCHADVIVVAGGSLYRRPIDSSGAHVIAVDRGVEHALALGMTIDTAVGDFDSLAPELARTVLPTIHDVRRHDPDKDATDLELALDVAVDVAAGRDGGARSTGSAVRTLLLCVEGGRADHALANLLVCAAPRFRSLEIELRLGSACAYVVHGALHGPLPPGTVLSVIPVGGPAQVSLDGTKWPLQAETLDVGTTRGVSNEALGGPISLQVHSGTVILFHNA